MPYLLANKIEQLLIIAGPQSNNLLAALQMAREYQLKVTAFLLKPWTDAVKGNYQFSRLFLDEDEIIWIERDNWSNVASLAEQFKDSLNVPAFVLTEGASVAQALPGAKTLAADILHNEEELGLKFEHIFVDAGTGFSAAALIDGLAEYNHKAQVYVLILANQPQYLTPRATNYLSFYPQTAKAFGSLNQAIKQEMQRLAREEGILTDPVYSAKLFYESRRYIEKNQLQGPILIVHSGGLLTLTGFELTTY